MAKKIFLSYSRSDSEYITQLSQELRAAGQEVWMDNKIRTGQTWDQTVEQNIRNCEVLVVVMSKTSVASSNVMDEVSYGIGLNKIISPILIEECDVPMRLARYQYVDFSTLGVEEGTRKLVADINFDVQEEGSTYQPKPVSPPKIKPSSNRTSKSKKTLLYAGGAILVAIGVLFATGVISTEDTTDDFPTNMVETASSDDDAYANAKLLNTVKSYLDYSAKYSDDGKHLDEASAASTALKSSTGVIQYSEESDDSKENYFNLYKVGFDDVTNTPDKGQFIIALIDSDVYAGMTDNGTTGSIERDQVATVLEVQSIAGKVWCRIAYHQR